MGNIFIWANYLDHLKDLHQGKTQAIEQLIVLRNQIVFELRSRGCRSFVVPEDLNLPSAIEWIIDRADWGDIALAIGINYANDKNVRGTYITYISHNLERKKQAEIILLLLLQSLPHLVNRGSQADILTVMGNLPFCRQVSIPSLQITLGYLSNSEDQSIIFNESAKLVQGLADGLMAWSREVTGVEPNQHPLNFDFSLNHPSLKIKWNNRIYEEKGILVNGNPCLPLDLIYRLGIELIGSSKIDLITYQGIIYVKAVELHNYNIKIHWENLSQTLILKSILAFNENQFDKIMGQGKISEVQMMMFLKVNNEKALKDFSQIAKFYREEGAIEGVNSDIAFAQMCLETDFLRFGGNKQAESNNFANLGTIGDKKVAIFSHPRLGVRSHIQHLKAYASLEPLVLETVDPRFHVVARGIAPTLSQLSGLWSADLFYGNKIIALLKRLYESVNLL